MSHSCAKCGRPAGQSVRLDKDSLVIFAATHAEYEQIAWRCSNCNKVICGRCAFPRWQAMKAETGLSASALAAKLESDPDALFSESATCPFCRRSMDPIEEDQAGAGGCFIATAACGTAAADDVVLLRQFRDQFLRRWAVGRVFIRLYETLSPPIARQIAPRVWARSVTRWCIVQPATWLARICLQFR